MTDSGLKGERWEGENRGRCPALLPHFDPITFLPPYRTHVSHLLSPKERNARDVPNIQYRNAPARPTAYHLRGSKFQSKLFFFFFSKYRGWWFPRCLSPYAQVLETDGAPRWKWSKDVAADGKRTGH